MRSIFPAPYSSNYNNEITLEQHVIITNKKRPDYCEGAWTPIYAVIPAIDLIGMAGQPGIC